MKTLRYNGAELLRELEPTGASLQVSQYGYHDFAVIKPATRAFSQPFYTLHFVLAGSGTLHMCGKSYDLTEGHVFFVPPNTPKLYYPKSGDPWRYFWLVFNGPDAERYLAEARLTAASPVYEPKVWPHLLDTIAPLIEEPNAPLLKLAANAALYRAVALLAAERDTDGARPPRTRPKERLAEQVTDYIAANYADPDFDVDQLAQAVFLSHSYLCALFREVVGMPVQQYLIRLRMRQAEKLLAETDLPLKEVAAACGYRDIVHFTKYFKSRHGVTPGAYRKRI